MSKTGFGAAQEIVDEQKEKAQQNETPKFERFKLEQDGPPKQVRFVVADGEDSVVNFIEHWTKFNNGWTRNYECPNEKPNEGKCFTCNGPKSIYLEDQRKPAHLISLIERIEDGDDMLKVWRFSPMVMTILLDYLNTNSNISDRDYTIQFVKNVDAHLNESIKTKFYYIIEPATTKAVKLTAGDTKLIEERLDLVKLIPVYDAENLEKISKMTKEESEKKTGPKATDVAKIFLNTLGGATGEKKNLNEEFKAILAKKGTTETAVVETEEEEATTSGDDSKTAFEKLLQKIND